MRGRGGSSWVIRLDDQQQWAFIPSSDLAKGLERSSLGAQEQDPSSMEATYKLSLSSAPWHSHTGPKTAAALSEMPDFSPFTVFGPALPSAGAGGAAPTAVPGRWFLITRCSVHLSAIKRLSLTSLGNLSIPLSSLQSLLLLPHLLGLRSASPAGPLSGFLAKYAYNSG